jgi:hypothetical protein
MKKIATIITAVAALGLQACAIQGSHKFTPLGVKIQRSLSLGSAVFEQEETSYQTYHRRTTTYTPQTYQRSFYCDEQPYHVPYPGQERISVGPQYYKIDRPVPGYLTRRIDNHMSAPIVAETTEGSSVIIPRSWR